MCRCVTGLEAPEMAYQLLTRQSGPRASTGHVGLWPTALEVVGDPGGVGHMSKL